jgi:hypothetical protein
MRNRNAMSALSASSFMIALVLLTSVLSASIARYPGSPSPNLAAEGRHGEAAAETAAQFWKRFVAAVKKGDKETVANSFDWSNLQGGFWSEDLISTRPAFVRNFSKLFTKFVKKDMAKARLERADSYQVENLGVAGPLYFASFLCGPTTYSDGTELGCCVQFYIAQRDQEWKIVASMIAG